MFAFQDLVSELQRFKLTCAPANEAEIEQGIERFLKGKHYPVRRQVIAGKDRFDLVVGAVVLEMKLFGSKSVAEQLDRYSGSCEGLILICWKASAPLKRIFAATKIHSKISIELIELYRNCGLV